MPMNFTGWETKCVAKGSLKTGPNSNNNRSLITSIATNSKNSAERETKQLQKPIWSEQNLTGGKNTMVYFGWEVPPSAFH